MAQENAAWAKAHRERFQCRFAAVRREELESAPFEDRVEGTGANRRVEDASHDVLYAPAGPPWSRIEELAQVSILKFPSL
jgi:hypothetical protein